MKVKKYQGNNMQDAISKVKADLGSDAIIIHSRKFKEGGFLGLFAKKKVEVVATVEPQQQNNNDNLQLELNQMKGMMDSLMGEIQNNQNKELKVMDTSTLQRLVDALLQLELSYVRARELAQTIIEKLDGANLEDKEQVKKVLKEELKSEINTVEPIKLEEDKTKVVALVGPTGVGKTTTLAKLASKFALFEEKRVALITTDTYRIAAVDQLKTYSGIINLPLEVVFTPQELETTIKNYQDYDLVLIDTAGRSQNNQMHISELKAFMNQAPIDEISLVLSATTKVTDVLRIIEVYQQIKLDKLIITKLDETNSLGVIFEAVAKSKKPLSYLTIGQDVPEDIKLAEPEMIVQNIIEGLSL